MEKPKRKARKSNSRLVILLLTIIAVLSMALGATVFTLQVDSLTDNAILSDEIIPYDVTSTTCAPLKRTYLEPIVTNEMLQTGGYNLTGTPIMTGSGGGGNMNAVPTSAAMMNTVPPQNLNQNIQPTMHGPATYTPMPSMTASPMGTPMPQAQMTQANTTAYNAPQQPVTELNARLSAGEIDDNAEWDVYMTYRRNFAESPANASPVDDVDVRDRQLIRVINSDGEPILGATVDILLDDQLIQSSCTYATGYTMFLPYVYDVAQTSQFHIRVSKDGISNEAELHLSETDWTLTLDVEQDQANLDILFLIDATGSMDDEIAQLTNNILYISEEIHKLPDDINIRFGLVSYKDGNYPTQVWDFTPNVNQFQAQLAQLYTAGGAGETLNDGLDRALHAVQWRGDDTAKLIFLVGDEPPGVYENHPSYAVSMLLAGQAGIKVHPIASSGLDVQGEYIFRQIAQTTMGHFIFLTYGDGQTAVQTTGDVAGSVGDEAFGEYSVEQLHEIVLNLIQDELMTFRTSS